MRWMCVSEENAEDRVKLKWRTKEVDLKFLEKKKKLLYNIT